MNELIGCDKRGRKNLTLIPQLKCAVRQQQPSVLIAPPVQPLISYFGWFFTQSGRDDVKIQGYVDFNNWFDIHIFAILETVGFAGF